jgi:RHS repeat-associated protein
MSMPSPVSVHYRRDLLGRIVAAGQDASNPKSYGAWRYNPDGTIAEETLAGGIVRSFVYDGLGRPVRRTEPAMTCDLTYRQAGDIGSKPYASGAISGERVSYRAEAFPAGPAPQPLTTSYTYDANGRLLAASASRADASLAASYDANGNLESLAAGGKAQSYSYQGSNRLVAVTPSGGAGRTFGHDADGAVTDAGGRALFRDPVTGQLRRGSGGAGTVSFLRDARGWPALTSAGTTKRLQLRDAAGAPLLELESTGGGAAVPTLAHIQGATGRAAMWLGGTLYALGRDVRGSTGIVYGPDGKPAAWFGFRAYGTPDAAATSTNTLTAKIRWRYTGQEWNEALALYDYGARLYDPAIARFLSPDPADQTPSPYMYVAGDPVNAVDPSGSVPIYLAFYNKRIFGMNEKRQLIFSVPYTGTLDELKQVQNIRGIFDAWNARMEARGGHNLINNLYIPMVDDFGPEHRLTQFHKFLVDVIEDGNSLIKQEMSGRILWDYAREFKLTKNVEAAWANVATHPHSIPRLKSPFVPTDFHTPNKRWAMERAYGNRYMILDSRGGPVAVLRSSPALTKGRPALPKVPAKGPSGELPDWPYQIPIPPSLQTYYKPPAGKKGPGPLPTLFEVFYPAAKKSPGPSGPGLFEPSNKKRRYDDPT